jgi:hypothetical protein
MKHFRTDKQESGYGVDQTEWALQRLEIMRGQR